MVRQLFVSVVSVLAAIPPACGEPGRKQEDLAGRNYTRYERGAGQRDSGIQKVAVSTGELS